MNEMDNDELKAALERSERENRLLKGMIQALPLQILAFDQNDQIILCNSKAATCLDLDPEQVEHISPSQPGEKISHPNLVREEGFELTTCEEDGETRWVNQARTKLCLDGRDIWMYTGEDITRFKEVEHALKNRENRIKAILDNAVEGIITINMEGTVETFNPAAAHIFGYATSEVIGQNIKMLMPEPYFSEHDFYLSSYLKTSVPKIIGKGREVLGRRKDGTIFPMHLSVSVVKVAQNMLFTGIIRDLTEYKKMQDDVARSQHLAMVGEMAATIAHEIRNPLAGISGALQIICEGLGADDPHSEILGEVFEQVVRLSKSVNDLLMFTKKWEPVRQHFSLEELVSKVSRTASMESAFKQVDFDIDLAQGAWAYIDPMLVEQILWNLFQNARDACSGKGVITVRSENVGKFTRLSISDNGSGIEPETLAKIFKPFFTTKTQGTGLGLPITKRIMEAHGGDVQIKSVIGEGTEIILGFPQPPKGLDNLP